MAKELVLVDTSILIDFFRKSDKVNSRLLKAVHYSLPFATLNTKHFERIEELQILQ